MSQSALKTKPYRVLVVDDDALSRDLVALLLGSEGHETLKADSGEEALRMLAQLDEAVLPDVLLVDMQMPGESGSLLARHLRLVSGQARIVAMSASVPAAEEMEGFDAFLIKPLDVDDFHAVVGEEMAPRPAGACTLRDPAAENCVLDTRIFSNLENTMPSAAIEEIYAACLGDTRTRVAAMRKYAAAGDEAAVRAAAHAIKGGAGMVGAVRMARLAAHLELEVYGDDDVSLKLDELLDACSELERILLTRREPNTRQS